MGLVFNGGRSTQEAGAFMGGGLDGLWQIAFPFDAKVMATGSKASEGDTEIGVIFGVRVVTPLTSMPTRRPECCGCGGKHATVGAGCPG